MNKTQRMNRPKRLRLALEASGSAAATANHTPTILALAADKTPSYKRVGNYYAKTKQGKHNTYLNVVPRYKLNKTPVIPGIFAKVWNSIKQKFGFNKYVVPRYKLNKTPVIPGIFAKVWNSIKQKFGFNKYAVR